MRVGVRGLEVCATERCCRRKRTLWFSMQFLPWLLSGIYFINQSAHFLRPEMADFCVLILKNLKKFRLALHCWLASVTRNCGPKLWSMKGFVVQHNIAAILREKTFSIAWFFDNPCSSPQFYARAVEKDFEKWRIHRSFPRQIGFPSLTMPVEVGHCLGKLKKSAARALLFFVVSYSHNCLVNS